MRKEARMGCISVSVRRVGGINVGIGIVCTAGNTNYLRVAPTDVQWVSTWQDATLFVESNTDWITSLN